MSNGLKKVALVTGGGRRIGAEICRHLHRRGYRIAVHCNQSTAQASQLCDELNDLRKESCHGFQADLSDGGECRQLIDAVVSYFEGLNVLVNNASAYFSTPLEQAGESDWNTLLDTNLRAPFILAQGARESLAHNRGCIINLLDAHTSLPTRNYTIYHLSKTALGNLTQSLALEYAPEIRVNAIAPGAILWPEDADFGEQQQQAMLEKIPLGALGCSEDIAAAVTFLADDAPYVTGQLLAVDGGRGLT